MMFNRLMIMSVATMLLVSCSMAVTNESPGMLNVSSFETQYQTIEFTHTEGFHYEAPVDNPRKCGLNVSGKCAKVVSSGNPWEVVHSVPLGRTLDFTANPPVFKLKVLAPVKGARVYMKLYPTKRYKNDYQPVEITDVVTGKAGKWEELIFDFTSFDLPCNVYDSIMLIFNAGVGDNPGEEWYFDDLMIPDDDLSSISLFKRYEGNPVFRPEGEQTWKDAHIANAAIVTPSDSPDGNWRLYIRGSGHTPVYHDQIGLYTQKASDFKPFGPWDEYEGNPVIPYGDPGSYDEMYLLDCVPVVGKDDITYVYYKARRFDFSSSTGLASSVDGYNFTKLSQPKVKGACDALYHEGRYYIFAGARMYVGDDPYFLEGFREYPLILPGGAPSNFDSKILWGTMVFRLEGIDKWFLSYQGSSTHPDFPDRFHLAMSDDLIHWTKVQNPQPMFTRGAPGQWDQGGIWYPEIIEHEGKLYLYYEGWGREGFVADRNQEYFQGGSCTGVAWVEKDEFLKWCGLL